VLGFVNVIKPTGVSSGYVVNKIKYLTKEKVGHLGTLDPLASGVLPIAVGKATRFFDYFLNKDKKYFALIKFGVLTDTLDAEGKIVDKKKANITLKQLQESVVEFLGETKQIPPIYSARSKDGVRGYQAALKNKNIQLDSKIVNIYSIDVNDWHEENVFSLTIHCSSGTYVRSLLRDIGEKLNTVATTVAIIRLKSGPFKLEDAVTLEDLEQNANDCLIGVEEVINKPRVDLSIEEAQALYSGKIIDFKRENGEYLCFYNNEIFSLANCEDQKLKNKIYLYEKEKVW